MVLLFDIDGTLCLAGNLGVHRRSFIEVLAETTGLPITLDDWQQLSDAGLTNGNTDLAIAREILRRHNLSDEQIDAQLDTIKALVIERFLELSENGDSVTMIDGALEGLEQVHAAGVKLALLTGNLEELAYIKMRHLGLEHFFIKGQGAFGSDAEDRNTFVAIASERLPEPDDHLAIVGDTPRDIAAARAGGIQVIAVATGAYGPEELRDADVVIESLRELPRALRELGWPLETA